MARAWAESLEDRRRMAMVRSFVGLAISAYAEKLGVPVRTPAPDFTSATLDFRASNLAATIGIGAGELDPLAAFYWLSVTYTAMLPDALDRKSVV